MYLFTYLFATTSGKINKEIAYLTFSICATSSLVQFLFKILFLLYMQDIL